MRNMEEIMRRIPWRKSLWPGTYGTELTIGDLKGTVIFTPESDDGWEHVSFSPYNLRKLPSWEDMCKLKDIFWGEEEDVIQIHPKRSEYVNIMQNCLHLWRHPKMLFPETEKNYG